MKTARISWMLLEPLKRRKSNRDETKHLLEGAHRQCNGCLLLRKGPYYDKVPLQR